jgi:hypothetical protein
VVSGETLGERRNVNVVLRLVVDRDGSLQQGEVLDVKGAHGGRFSDWDAMIPLIRRMVGAIRDEGIGE